MHIFTKHYAERPPPDLLGIYCQTSAFYQIRQQNPPSEFRKINTLNVRMKAAKKKCTIWQLYAIKIKNIIYIINIALFNYFTFETT